MVGGARATLINARKPYELRAGPSPTGVPRDRVSCAGDRDRGRRGGRAGHGDLRGAPRGRWTDRGLDGAVRPGAKILVSGGSRCNVTNAEVTEADFSGSPRAPPPKRPAGVRSRGDRRVLPRDRRRSSRGGERQALSGREPIPRRPAGAAGRGRPSRRGAAGGGGGCRPSSRRGAGFRRADRANGDPRRPGRAGHRRPLAAEDGERRPRPPHRRGARSLGRADDTGARAPRPRRLVSRAPLTGIAHEVAVVVRAAGRTIERRAGSLLWTHFGVSGPRRARRVAGLAAGAARGPRGDGRGQPPSRARLRGGGGGPRAACGREPARRRGPGPLAVASWGRGGGGRPRGGRRRHPGGPSAARRATRLVHGLVARVLPVAESRGYDFAEATAGGVPLAEVDTRTMESRRQAGLFLVGEMLDVDGRIGGFNFQWSWSSAWVAAGGLSRGL